MARRTDNLQGLGSFDLDVAELQRIVDDQQLKEEKLTPEMVDESGGTSGPGETKEPSPPKKKKTKGSTFKDFVPDLQSTRTRQRKVPKPNPSTVTDVPKVRKPLNAMLGHLKEPIVVNITGGSTKKDKGKSKGKRSSNAGSESNGQTTFTKTGNDQQLSGGKKKNGNKINCPYCDMEFVSKKHLKNHPVYCEMMKNFEFCEKCLFCKRKFPYSIRRLHAFICKENDTAHDLNSGNLETQSLFCPQCKEKKLAIDLPYHLSECLTLLQSMLTMALDSKMKWDTPVHNADWIDQAGLCEWLETSKEKATQY